MDQQSAKQQFVERVKSANNVLVTVSKDPSLDQLASALGLTLMLNKMGKHATAVASGEIPSAMQFLEPGKTIDNSVDSLRDFVISLSTEKADKLRYKKEDGVVKIFITPYKTKLTQDDFDFTQGDFNVDVVIALGVSDRDHLDEAIRAHGRILHDATVVTISNESESSLGSIDWTVPEASSLSEMLVSVSEAFEGGILDEPMSTAFLTGIVSATDRFRNKKTSPKVMTMAAQLMAAGANQQLVASNLEAGNAVAPDSSEPASKDVPTDPPPVDLPPVVEPSFDVPGGDEPPSDINQLLQAAEESAQTDQPADNQQAADDSLNDLQKELESLTDDLDQEAPAEQQEPKTEQADVPTEAPAEPHEMQMPDSDTVDLNTDATSAVPLEEQPNETPQSDPALPTLEDIEADINAASLPPAQPSPGQAMAAPSEAPVQDQVQTTPNISQSRGVGANSPMQDEPALGGTFNATSRDAEEQNRPENQPSINNAMLSHSAPPTPQANMTNEQVQMGTNQPPQISTNPQPPQPLSLDVDDARRAVEEAALAAEPTVANNPIQSLNAQELPGANPQGAMAIPPPQPQLPPQPAPQQPPMQPMPGPGPAGPQPGNDFGLPQQPVGPPPGGPQPQSPLAPPPPPPGGSAPVIAPKVSPANLGSFAPAGPPPQQPMPQPPAQPGAMPPLGPPGQAGMQQGPPPQQQPPQFGMPPAPGSPAPPPAPIQFDSTPPPGNMPNQQF